MILNGTMCVNFEPISSAEESLKNLFFTEISRLKVQQIHAVMDIGHQPGIKHPGTEFFPNF